MKRRLGLKRISPPEDSNQFNSGPIKRVGREKRHGAVEDIDSSIYETDPGTNILKVHLISMRTLCVHYSRKTRSPSHIFWW